MMLFLIAAAAAVPAVVSAIAGAAADKREGKSALPGLQGAVRPLALWAGGPLALGPLLLPHAVATVGENIAITSARKGIREWLVAGIAGPVTIDGPSDIGIVHQAEEAGWLAAGHGREDQRKLARLRWALIAPHLNAEALKAWGLIRSPKGIVYDPAVGPPPPLPRESTCERSPAAAANQALARLPRGTDCF